MEFNLGDALEFYYKMMEGNEQLEEYHRRHETQSLLILTVFDDERAAALAWHLRERIEGKIVVEIGGGIGLLGCHLADYAKQVICFEADPSWMSSFVHVLYEKKPRNLTYIFGDARQLTMFRGDVALFCTRSGHADMQEVASLFAPEVIDVYAELFGTTDVKKRT